MLIMVKVTRQQIYLGFFCSNLISNFTQLTMKIIDKKECRRRYSNFPDWPIGDAMICAIDRDESGKSPCGVIN